MVEIYQSHTVLFWNGGDIPVPYCTVLKWRRYTSHKLTVAPGCFSTDGDTGGRECCHRPLVTTEVMVFPSLLLSLPWCWKWPASPASTGQYQHLLSLLPSLPISYALCFVCGGTWEVLGKKNKQGGCRDGKGVIVFWCREGRGGTVLILYRALSVSVYVSYPSRCVGFEAVRLSLNFSVSISVCRPAKLCALSGVHCTRPVYKPPYAFG